MIDRAWMLNPKAIRTAKECIDIVKRELDVKLTFSHPQFMQVLHGYVERTNSRELAEAYSRLLSMAGVGNVMHGLSPELEASDQDVELKSALGTGSKKD